MKKLLIAVGMGLMAGSLYAACQGPYCYDDKGATINNVPVTGAGFGLPNITAANIVGACPIALGQQVFCTNCSLNQGRGGVCVSTATTCNSATTNFDYMTSSGTTCQ